MNMQQVREIASAILYEGYLLYPYRHSAIKNRQRWTFGVVYPRAYSEANGNLEPWSMHTECLLDAQPGAALDVYVAFLHLLKRSVAQAATVGMPTNADEQSLLLASQLAYEPWEEGIEREISALNIPLRELLVQPRRIDIAFSSGRLVEHPADARQAEITREQQALTGAITIAAAHVAHPAHPQLYQISAHIENTTPVAQGEQERWDAILLQAFISTHTILRARQGSFISLLETPEALRDAAKSCQNRHTWPVLVGQQGERDTVLSSPIILYDYPQIAPESPGAFFDGTEIDEILALRILTLSNEEKAELRQGDERARELLERVEALSPEQFMKLHGTIRDARPLAAEKEEELSEEWLTLRQDYPGEDYPPPASVRVTGGEARVGSRVILHPRARADAFDLLLKERSARVEAIQQDFENRLYLVVTLDDDPGREQRDERVLPGHRFFFFPEEVELA